MVAEQGDAPRQAMEEESQMEADDVAVPESGDETLEMAAKMQDMETLLVLVLLLW